MNLMPHQVQGIDWLRSRPRALLADDPGLGKTAQALLAAEPPVLVVAPAMLAGTWRNEIALWRREWQDEDVAWVSYSSLCERNGYKVNPVVRQQYLRDWKTVIFDEAHYLKNRKAKWTKAALSLAKHTERLMLLTGTPIPNWAHELYIPLRLLHEPSSGAYSSYWRWVETYFSWWTPRWGGGTAREIGSIRNDVGWDVFAEENDLGTLMLRRRREDVLRDLPSLTESTIEVPMTTPQRKAYEELKADYFTWLEEAGAEVAAFSDGALYIKLAKVTTGLATLIDQPEMATGSGKMDALAELLDEREGSPVVVFSHFRSTAHCIARLGRSLGWRVGIIMGGIPQQQRDALVDEFQRGDLDLLVGTLETLGEGVTLTRSATCIFVEHSWRPSKNEQAMRRLHRIGQKAPVTVIHLITEKSLDQRIMALLAAKTGQQMQTLRAAEFAALL